MQSNQHCSVDLPHCTHLDGVWNKQGLLRNWDKGFTFLFLESKAKFTPPYPSSSLPPAQEKGRQFAFPFMGLTPFGTSSALLYIRPSLLPVAGEGADKEELICLRPYEVDEPPLGSWPSSTVVLTVEGVKAHPRLLASTSFCLREEWEFALCRLHPSIMLNQRKFFCVWKHWVLV